MAEPARDDGEAIKDGKDLNETSEPLLLGVPLTGDEKSSSNQVPTLVIRGSGPSPKNVAPARLLHEDSSAHLAPISEDGPSLDKWWHARYGGPFILLYISHFLSSWGDRMWAFTMGMLLIDWENLQSLRTVAIHQLCQASAVFIFGAIIGSWVDRTRRLRATVSSIIAQNIFVVASAMVLLVLLKTTEDRKKDDPALWHHHFAVALAIAFSTLAYMASVACQLTVVKDWVPILCNENREKLTMTNASLKRIDLSTAILSPLLAGAVMEAAGPWAGGVVVVVWNVISAPCEIALLYTVYRRNQKLQLPKGHSRPMSTVSISSQNNSSKHLYLSATSSGSNGCCSKVPVMRPAVTLVRGWRTYWSQVVRWSGASLSALYFTVLSFDSVTFAYVRSLCVSELVVAGVRIGSFVFGLVGTIVFPHIRSRFGLRRGGSIFYVSHAIIIAIAVISIFLPGSPFGPIGSNEITGQKPITLIDNFNVTKSNETSTTLAPDFSTTTILMQTGANTVNVTLSEEFSSSNFTQPLNKTAAVANGEVQCVKGDNVGGFRLPHLGLLTAAVILSRLTLWGTDLSINQGLVERVASEERGVVNGVQGSLNQLVDLFRLVTVICVPYPSQFGYLIIATFVWIVGGAILYIFGAPADEIQTSPGNARTNDLRMDRFSRSA